MMKYAIIFCSLLFALHTKAEDLPERGNPKLDSLLNLTYSALTSRNTIDAIAVYSKVQSMQIDSAVNFINALPTCWAMSPVYKYRMDRLVYRQLAGYAVMVKQEYDVYEKIENQFKPNSQPQYIEADKPVIYLYPEKETKINVNLGFTGIDLYTWPKIDAGMNWSIIAQPNGMLKDAAGEEYPYLFWEGKLDAFAGTDMGTGFVVKGNETEEFLRDKLKLLGLNSREYTDFITYWGPRMHKNKYNLIRFETAVYNQKVPLNIYPEPESSQRILMVYQGLDNQVEVKPQVLQPFTRKGYTLIEWGGTELPKIVN